MFFVFAVLCAEGFATWLNLRRYLETHCYFVTDTRATCWRCLRRKSNRSSSKSSHQAVRMFCFDVAREAPIVGDLICVLSNGCARSIVSLSLSHTRRDDERRRGRVRCAVRDAYAERRRRPAQGASFHPSLPDSIRICCSSIDSNHECVSAIRSLRRR